MRFNLLLGAISAVTLFGSVALAQAQDVTLRIHHFMSSKATLHEKMLVPLAERIEKASDGRIKVELYDSMSLGGRPGDLYDQAVDGAIEVVLTLPGYTAGRFPQAEVFELPFIMDDSVAASKAFWDLIESDLQNSDFEEVKILSGWVHGPGVIHTKDPVVRLEDLKGMEMRGPTRLVTDLLGELGASPVGMPLPKIPESLSKGVISGAVVPWEITPSIKLAELVNYHTQLDGDKALYTAIFVLAMNYDAYDEMPEDLRAILDAETGKTLSEIAGQVMADGDAVGLDVARTNNIITLGQKEAGRWEEASKPVYDRWIEMASDSGFDGAATIDKAKSLIEKNK